MSGLLLRLFAESDAKDPALLARIGAEADSRYGGQRYVPQLAPLFDQAFLPVPPEVGQFLYVAIRGQDYFVIQGVVLMLIVALAVLLFLVDLIYPLLDPRIRR